MTTEELIKYKKDYNARIAELENEYQDKEAEINKIKKDQIWITSDMRSLVDEHEKVCQEFNRG